MPGALVTDPITNLVFKNLVFLRVVASMHENPSLT